MYQAIDPEDGSFLSVLSPNNPNNADLKTKDTDVMFSASQIYSIFSLGSFGVRFVAGIATHLALFKVLQVRSHSRRWMLANREFVLRFSVHLHSFIRVCARDLVPSTLVLCSCVLGGKSHYRIVSYSISVVVTHFGLLVFHLLLWIVCLLDSAYLSISLSILTCW